MTVQPRIAAWRVRGLTFAAVLALAVAGAGMPAHAQIDSREGIALQNQILELKQQIQQMQQLQVQANGPQSSLPPPAADAGPPAYSSQPAANGDITAQLLVRVSALEEQMRALHGRIEELANTEQRDHDDLAKQIGDLAFKLGQGGGSAGAPAQAVPPPADSPASGMDLSSAAPPPPPPPPPPTHRTAEVALKQGNAALARRDYPAAEAAAREALALGRGHGPDANFLLARALAGEHQYKPAAATYYAVYKSSPKSPRGAEGLLGVANAMIGLGDNHDACEAVAKFNAEFPRADSALHAAAASIRKRAACR
jgi:TolA-binding protein